MPDDFVRLTTASLIDGLRNRCNAQWFRFVKTFGPLVISWLRRTRLPRSDVEDLVQEVFSSALEGFDNYRHDPQVDGSFRRWLWGITKNKVARHFSTLADTPKASGGSTAHRIFHEMPDLPFEELDNTTDQVTIDLAMRAVQIMKTDFEKRTWQAFWKTAIEGIPTHEVAHALQMSSNQVRQSRSRIIRRLREEFGTDVSIFYEKSEN